MLLQCLARLLKLLRCYWTSWTSCRPVSGMLILLSLLRKRFSHNKPESSRLSFSTHELPSVVQAVRTVIGASYVPPQFDGGRGVEAPPANSVIGLTPSSPQPVRKYSQLEFLSGGDPSIIVPAGDLATEAHSANSLRSISRASGASSSDNHTPGERSSLDGRPTSSLHHRSPSYVADNLSPARHIEGYLNATGPSLAPPHPNLAIPISSFGPHDPFRPASRLSVSSCNSRGRASYRRYEGSSRCAGIGISNLQSPSTTTLAGGRSFVGPSDHTESRLIAPPKSPNGTVPGDPIAVHLIPISADDLPRYKRQSFNANLVIDPEVSCHDIPGLTFKYPSPRDFIRDGWTTEVHPEGARYFINNAMRTCVEVDIFDDDIFTDVNFFANWLHDRLCDVEKHIPVLKLEDVLIVLEPQSDGLEIVCCYYLVNLRDRYLFWLSDYDAGSILRDCKGVTLPTHTGLAVRAQYWKHCDLFPHLCPVTQDSVDEVKGMLLHAYNEQLTSLVSCAPFTTEELRCHLDVIEKIDVKNAIQRPYSTCIISRVMYSLVKNQYRNFHGELGARLSFNQTVHGWTYTRSKTMSIVSPLLFNAPDAHTRSLHNIFVDGIARVHTWDEFTAMLNKELQDSNLLATVLLGVNVGFLAIGSVDDGNGRAFSQIASYMSLIASIGSIVLGLIFVRNNRSSGLETIVDTARFLERNNDEKHGLEKLAIVYSLPYAFLIWGMFFFLVAFSVEWCKPGDISSWVLVGAILFSVGALIIWGAYTAGDGRERVRRRLQSSNVLFWLRSWFKIGAQSISEAQDSGSTSSKPNLKWWSYHWRRRRGRSTGEPLSTNTESAVPTFRLHRGTVDNMELPEINSTLDQQWNSASA
ncbi:hypothetical protein BV22DRAFT_1038352 [Leucogyrophana mollusca]|uniref:Uncharacterized protein n=1 Tax=Leucogyrophana mollusca TaxID=85980 RepID=A0ACB8B7D3_9AGAM|nr:hypothetical protein BV22DRAFT_1038352 [Leucogyrophana mollusca]